MYSQSATTEMDYSLPNSFLGSNALLREGVTGR